MKYSQWIGLLATIMVVIACYLPWIEIPSLSLLLTGMDGQGTNLGKPGKLHIIFCVPAFVLFLLPLVWAKRVNWLLCALGLAWAVRNFLIYARCEMATCPERQYGLYLVLLGSVVMLAASLLPDMKIVDKKQINLKPGY
ncbi:MAG TPA: hypothetical protein PLL71_11580 [Agriterribacter sp.]|nr:hypothetical protein [Agriterribacter sp.]HRQ49227.1 hypothetical protein [Agriterribacter sp.]